jgi:NAD(P)-dependent dehydrogenase (short-subunit alcohol dehydrogenase family)
MSEVTDRRYVITGAGSGIGLATAKRLVDAGAEVMILGRRRAVLEDACAQLGERSWWSVCDLADAQAIQELVATIRQRWDRVDGVVNNAGIATMGRVEETSAEAWDEVMAVNVRGPFLIIQGLLPLIAASDCAAIVNISSSLAVKPIPGAVAYNASKAALNQMTCSLALELAPDVRVNAIMPAVVDTPIHATRGLTAADLESMAGLHPLQRLGQPDDIAATVVHLLSDDAAWITGAVIPVDGGMLVT